MKFDTDSGYAGEFFLHVGVHLAAQGGGTVVEIGGRMGAWLRDLMLYTGCVDRAFAIDPWLSRRKRGLFDVFPLWLEALEPWAFKKVFPLRGRSQDWGRVLPVAPDVVYVDGSHRYAEVLEDLRVWWPKLKSGGLLLMHDVNEDDVDKAAREFFGGAYPGLHRERWGPKAVETLWTMNDGKVDDRSC